MFLDLTIKTYFNLIVGVQVQGHFGMFTCRIDSRLQTCDACTIS